MENNEESGIKEYVNEGCFVCCVLEDLKRLGYKKCWHCGRKL